MYVLQNPVIVNRDHHAYISGNTNLFRKFSTKNFFKKFNKSFTRTLMQTSSRNKHLLTTNVRTGIWENFVNKPSPSRILFLKRKFGLFKTHTFLEKRMKKKLTILSNLISGKLSRKDQMISFKRAKILFAKKFNKLFFRAGRSIFSKYFNLKKYTIQKYITKKIFPMLTKPWLTFMRCSQLSNVLVQSKLFLSVVEAEKFIYSHGIVLNNTLVHDSNIIVKTHDVFSIPFSKKTLKFFRKHKSRILRNLLKIKFYKYRAKLFFGKRNFIWTPTSKWIQNNSFVYTSKFSNIEFDPRIMTGVILYEFELVNYANLYDKLDLSLYMMRSYNWKYIT